MSLKKDRKKFIKNVFNFAEFGKGLRRVAKSAKYVSNGLIVDAFKFLSNNGAKYRSLDKLHYLLNEIERFNEFSIWSFNDQYWWGWKNQYLLQFSNNKEPIVIFETEIYPDDGEEE